SSAACSASAASVRTRSRNAPTARPCSPIARPIGSVSASASSDCAAISPAPSVARRTRAIAGATGKSAAPSRAPPRSAARAVRRLGAHPLTQRADGPTLLADRPADRLGQRLGFVGLRGNLLSPERRATQQRHRRRQRQERRLVLCRAQLRDLALLPRDQPLE